MVCVWFDLHASPSTAVSFLKNFVFNILLSLGSEYNLIVKRVGLSILHAKLQGSGEMKIIYEYRKEGRMNGRVEVEIQ